MATPKTQRTFGTQKTVNTKSFTANPKPNPFPYRQPGSRYEKAMTLLNSIHRTENGEFLFRAANGRDIWTVSRDISRDIGSKEWYCSCPDWQGQNNPDLLLQPNRFVTNKSWANQTDILVTKGNECLHVFAVQLYNNEPINPTYNLPDFYFPYAPTQTDPAKKSCNCGCTSCTDKTHSTKLFSISEYPRSLTCNKPRALVGHTRKTQVGEPIEDKLQNIQDELVLKTGRTKPIRRLIEIPPGQSPRFNCVTKTIIECREQVTQYCVGDTLVTISQGGEVSDGGGCSQGCTGFSSFFDPNGCANIPPDKRPRPPRKAVCPTPQAKRFLGWIKRGTPQSDDLYNGDRQIQQAAKDLGVAPIGQLRGFKVFDTFSCHDDIYDLWGYANSYAMPIDPVSGAPYPVGSAPFTCPLDPTVPPKPSCDEIHWVKIVGRALSAGFAGGCAVTRVSTVYYQMPSAEEKVIWTVPLTDLGANGCSGNNGFLTPAFASTGIPQLWSFDSYSFYFGNPTLEYGKGQPPQPFGVVVDIFV